MTDLDRLMRMCRESGMSWSKVSDLQAAIELVDPTFELASELLGMVQAQACLYHAKKNAGVETSSRRLYCRSAAREASGGPQHDPGDETMPMFD